MNALLIRLLSTDRRVWLVTFGICLTVLGATAHWYGLTSVDPQAADLGAWQLVHHRTLYLDGASGLPDNPFLVRANGHVVAGRTAGVILVGVPFQLVLAPFGLPPGAAGALAATVLTALALANAALLAVRLGSGPRLGLTMALVLGFGTPVWTVAGADLWTHGPDLLWLSMAMLAAERAAWLPAGLAFSAAIWTRPHLALIAAGTAVAAAWARRAWRPVLVVGVTTGVALLCLVAWNYAVYGNASISGAYYSYAVGRVSATGVSENSDWLHNILLGSLSPLRGFVLYSPVVLPALWLALRRYRQAPSWAVGAAAGGAVYLLAQWHVNDYTGGTAFFGNRLVIETMAAVFPLCAWAYACGPSSARLRRIVRATAAISMATHATGALLAYAPPNSYDTQGSAWRRWLLLDDVRSMHSFGWVLALACFGSALAVAFWQAPSRATLDVTPGSSPLSPLPKK